MKFKKLYKNIKCEIESNTFYSILGGVIGICISGLGLLILIISGFGKTPDMVTHSIIIGTFAVILGVMFLFKAISLCDRANDLKLQKYLLKNYNYEV